MSENSKPIRSTDEASKEFIRELLDGDETHGIDIDSIYFTKKGWVIFEFLKCNTVDPYESHPNRYSFNWRKFATLFSLAKKLGGRLILVNYSKEEEWKDHIKLLYVKHVDTKLAQEKSGRGYLEYLEATEKKMTLDEFKDWFRNLNSEATVPWEEED